MEFAPPRAESAVCAALIVALTWSTSRPTIAVESWERSAVPSEAESMLRSVRTDMIFEALLFVLNVGG